jgi:hypothetical protein
MLLKGVFMLNRRLFFSSFSALALTWSWVAPVSAFTVEDIQQCISALSVTQDTAQLNNLMASCSRLFTTSQRYLFRTRDTNYLLYIRKDVQTRQITQSRIDGSSMEQLFNQIKQLGADSGQLPENYSQWYRALPLYRF